jgi:hypothetical protein
MSCTVSKKEKLFFLQERLEKGRIFAEQKFFSSSVFMTTFILFQELETGIQGNNRMAAGQLLFSGLGKCYFILLYFS